MSKEQAVNLVKETQKELEECIFNGGTHNETSQIVMDKLGLEQEHINI